MTQSREPNDRDIFTRIAALEYQVTEIQNTQAQLRATIAPVLLRLHGRETRPKRTAGGYVTDAFVGRRPAFGIRVVERIDEVEDRLNIRIDGLNARMDSMDGKLDAILRNITGLGNS